MGETELQAEGSAETKLGAKTLLGTPQELKEGPGVRKRARITGPAILDQSSG